MNLTLPLSDVDAARLDLGASLSDLGVEEYAALLVTEALTARGVYPEPTTRRGRYARTVADLDLPSQFHDEEYESDPKRYALVERGRTHDWVSTFDTLEAAGRHHVDQEAAEDWDLDHVRDLDTGQKYRAEFTTTASFSPLP